MSKTGAQLSIPGTEFDEWDQRGDETDEQYTARMERAQREAELFEHDPTRKAITRGELTFPCVCGKVNPIVDMLPNAAGYRMCPHCGASGAQLLGHVNPEIFHWTEPVSNPLTDLLVEMENMAQRGAMFTEPRPTLEELLAERNLPPLAYITGDWPPEDTIVMVADMGPGKEPVGVKIELGENYPEPTINPENPPPTVTLCNVPTEPLTLEALEQMAKAALEKIEQDRIAKRQAQSRAEANAHYEQESIVEENRECINKGGTGADCMMCTGEACRYDGFGCWAPEVLNCLHDADERHEWNPEIRDARREELQADLERLQISEDRRKEMLDKIFAGKPSRPNVIYCYMCKQEIQTGDVVMVTGRGSRHVAKCTENA